MPEVRLKVSGKFFDLSEEWNRLLASSLPALVWTSDVADRTLDQQMADRAALSNGIQRKWPLLLCWYALRLPTPTMFTFTR